MNTQTPAPREWEVINDNTVTVQSCPDGIAVARFFGDDAGANAALLVAAPALIAALHTINNNLTALLADRRLDSTRLEFYVVRDARNAARNAIADAAKGTA
jgi:hypothetical protein